MCMCPGIWMVCITYLDVMAWRYKKAWKNACTFITATCKSVFSMVPHSHNLPLCLSIAAVSGQTKKNSNSPPSLLCPRLPKRYLNACTQIPPSPEDDRAKEASTPITVGTVDWPQSLTQDSVAQTRGQRINRSCPLASPINAMPGGEGLFITSAKPRVYILATLTMFRLATTGASEGASAQQPACTLPPPVAPVAE